MASKKTAKRIAPKKKRPARTTTKATPPRPKKKKSATKKAVTSSKKRPKALDWARGSGIKTPSRGARATTAKDAAEHPRYAKTRALVLTMFRECFASDEEESDETILATDPNDFDADPSTFYEYVEARFAVPQDPSNEYFGGYGGPVRDLVAFLAPRWDGKLRAWSP